MQQVHRLAIPNPFFEGRNSVYVLRGDPLTLIDTGVATDKAFEHLREGLATLRLRVEDIERVVLTHKHIDHIGNAWRVQQASGAEVWIHASECKSLTDVDPGGKRFEGLVTDKMRGWGVPEERLPGPKESGKMPVWRLESCEVRGLADGDLLPQGAQELEVLHTPGHTAGSICLRLGEVLFSGDHVLEELSPNVGAGDLRSRGLLARYLGSLEKVRDLEVTTTHPGHGASFGTPRQRCHELLSHHEARLAAVLRILRLRPATVYDVALELFGEMNTFHLMLGCAEANSHLELLVEREQVTVLRGVFHARG